MPARLSNTRLSASSASTSRTYARHQPSAPPTAPDHRAGVLPHGRDRRAGARDPHRAHRRRADRHAAPPQPDIALLAPRDDFYEAEHPRPADVLLLVEVADTSLAYDRDRKLPLYARFGIPEVWLIDIAGRTVMIHRDPQAEPGRYAARFPLEPPGLIQPVMLPDIELDLSALL
ncbi:MAG: Uma2 family endonuclease [Chromatiaceae bacterium]|nr:Uma2 family endonuclease [Chromatiaceae bacterium]